MDAPEYTHPMDDLSCKCTDAQWEQLEAMLEEADEFMADSDVGTLAQKELSLSNVRGVKTAIPSCLTMRRHARRK